jgi:SAM-dependent methyltransferase
MQISPFEDAFCQRETNCALGTPETFRSCADMVRRAGLPLHQDPPKNWDNLLAVHHACAMGQGAACLDAGAGDGSAFLPGLRRLGFRRLVGNNLDLTYPMFQDGVLYEKGDIERMKYLDESFDFIACLSVVEHGVNVDKFLSESARILRPGGRVFISTDYWEEPIDCGNRMAFGVPVKIFSPSDIEDMLKVAARNGLEPTSVVNLGCAKKTIEWIGLEYTFINLLLSKKP